jgi:hypothetical protein
VTQCVRISLGLPVPEHALVADSREHYAQVTGLVRGGEFHEQLGCLVFKMSLF